MKQVIKDMKKTFQIPEKQTVWEHGTLVRKYLFSLIDFLEDKNPNLNLIYPSWVIDYKYFLQKDLFSRKILSRYTLFHDCGKPYVVIKDEYG